ncbi:MAG: hypothetical protein AMXMBFR56_57920 [Polyangiaceae bacterium]
MLPALDAFLHADPANAARRLVLEHTREAALEITKSASPNAQAFADKLTSLAESPESWRCGQEAFWLVWYLTDPMAAAKYLVVTRSNQAALTMLAAAKESLLSEPVPRKNALNFIEALIASWTGCPEEVWLAVRDLQVNPPADDSFAKIEGAREILTLPPPEQERVSQQMMDAMRQTVLERMRRLSRRPAPAPQAPQAPVAPVRSQGHARQRRARRARPARAAPSASADPDPEPEPSPEPARRLLTTREAATYCSFKSTSALRKAKHEQRIVAAGSRGGRGTLMWDPAELDRFLRGGAPVTVESDRPGAAPEGVAHGQMENAVELPDRPDAGAGRLETERRRTPRASPDRRPVDRAQEGDQEGLARGGSGHGVPVADRPAGPRAGRPRRSAATEDALRRLRSLGVGVQGRAGTPQERKKR